MLAILSPEAVIFPSVDIAIGIESGDEDPIELFQKICYGFFLAVIRNEGISYPIDCARTDPFPGVGAASYDDCLARTRGFLCISRVYTDSKSRNLAAFVRDSNIDHTNMSREEGLQEAHPRENDGQGLIVTEEDVNTG